MKTSGYFRGVRTIRFPRDLVRITLGFVGKFNFVVDCPVFVLSVQFLRGRVFPKVSFRLFRLETIRVKALCRWDGLHW